MDIIVKVVGEYGEWYASRRISTELFRRTFSPLKTCDDDFCAMLTGDLIAGTESVNIVKRTRKDAAYILARELSEMIVNAMKKNDTHNGYGNDT